jgi:hypothetical protein
MGTTEFTLNFPDHFGESDVIKIMFSDYQVVMADDEIPSRGSFKSYTTDTTSRYIYIYIYEENGVTLFMGRQPIT